MGTCATRRYCAQCNPNLSRTGCRSNEVKRLIWRIKYNSFYFYRYAPGLFVIPSRLLTSISRDQGLRFSLFIFPPTLCLCTLGLHFLSYWEGSDGNLCNLSLICEKFKMYCQEWLAKKEIFKYFCLIYSRLNNM